MNIETVTKNNIAIGIVAENKPAIANVQAALDLVVEAKYQAGANRIAIPKEALAPEFFVLSTTLAGEILQKWVVYGVKAAIYGDFSAYTSKPLKDFMYECNLGSSFFFTATKEEAIEKLAAAPGPQC